MLESLSGGSWSAAAGMIGARVSAMAAIGGERAVLYNGSGRGKVHILGIGENEIAPSGWEINDLARTGVLSVFPQFAHWIARFTAERLATGARAAAISSAGGCNCCVLVHGWGGRGALQCGGRRESKKANRRFCLFVSPVTAAGRSFSIRLSFGGGPNAAIQVIHAAGALISMEGLRGEYMKGGCSYRREASGRQSIRINSVLLVWRRA